MKLAVCCNHAMPFFTGGSEKVINQICRSLTKDYGIECCVFSPFAKSNIDYDGYKVKTISKDRNSFFKTLKNYDPDHLFIYSDSYFNWTDLMMFPERLRAKKSIALVGANHMRKHKKDLLTFKKNSNHFKVITHSDNYEDYRLCNMLDIKAHVIPNGVNLEEFESNNIDFKNKYNIQNPIILCVSNFYPGKGQEYLLHILDKLHQKGNKFTAVFICSTVNFSPAEITYSNARSQLKKSKYPNLLLKDIPRSDVVAAFKSSSVFAFPSQIEVAPLVTLESMASGVPFVSLNVGNVSSLNGGLVVRGGKKFGGKFKYDARIFDEFINKIEFLLQNKKERDELGEKGLEQIKKEFDWSVIKDQYYQLFFE